MARQVILPWRAVRDVRVSHHNRAQPLHTLQSTRDHSATESNGSTPPPYTDPMRVWSNPRPSKNHQWVLE